MAVYLHLLKADAPALAAPVIEANHRQPGARVSVVVLHGAAPAALPADVAVRRLGPDDLAYSALLDLIFEADHVITW